MLVLLIALYALFPVAAAEPRSPPATGPAHVAAPVLPRRDVLPAARVSAAFADYNHWLDEIAAKNDVAGLATAIVVDGKVRYQRTLGYADSATGARVTPQTVFRLASLSKAFASALTGLLVQDGLLKWDTRISQAVPFFMLKNAEDAREATVADILSQRSGLPRNTYDNLLEDNQPYQELARKLDEVDMICPVGACYSYQNIAFALIGDVVYAATGDFFYHQVEKRLFLPLGMKTATYGRDALEHSASWARPHYRRGNRWVPFLPKEAFYRVPPAAGVNASLDDMEKWLIAQMGYRPDVLSPQLLATLHTPLVETPSERWATPWRRARLKNAQYALGWRVYDYAGDTLIFHAGAVQGYRAMIGFLPRYGIGMVILWNCDSPTPAGLMPMLLDRLLGLPHEDWAGLHARPAPPRHRVRHRH